MDAPVLRALRLAQGPSGECAEGDQLACPLLLRLTPWVGHVLHGPVGPVEAQRSSPPAAPRVMAPDSERMVHAAGDSLGCHECSAVRVHGGPSVGQETHGIMVASGLRLCQGVRTLRIVLGITERDEAPRVVQHIVSPDAIGLAGCCRQRPDGLPL
jgi:hypothetical protein